MTNREIALLFLNRFCAGDIEGLVPLLTADLQFQGPLFEFDTADEYLSRLRNDPPGACDHDILRERG